MARLVNIYALCDPDMETLNLVDGMNYIEALEYIEAMNYMWALKYIGQTVNIKTRLYEHIKKLHVGNKKKQDWIQSLLAQNKKPVMIILCVVDQSVAKETEETIIEASKMKGANLVNGTPRAFGSGQSGWAHGKSKKEKKKPSTTQSSIRLEPKTKNLIITLARTFKLTQSKIIERSVLELAKYYNVYPG